MSMNTELSHLPVPASSIWPPAWLKNLPVAAPTAIASAKLTPECMALWEERAAIMEYDGGLSRQRAEAEALADVAGLIDMSKRQSCGQ